MKDLLMFTTHADGTKQVLVESAEMIYNRVKALLTNQDVTEIQVFEKGTLIFSK